MNIIKIKQQSDLNLLSKESNAFSNGTVVSLGFFDGVHIAHRALINESKKIAHDRSLPLVIFTFFGQNSEIKSSKKRLLTDEEKISLLGECGADCIVIADFAVFKEMSAEDFVAEFLIRTLNAHVAVCGFNFRFGKGASGDFSLLAKLMQEFGRDAKIIDEYEKDGKTVSSSHIKCLIENKHPEEAATFLGKPYFISGKVSHGLGLGRQLGIPTVNTEFPHGKLIPPTGVYFTATLINGKAYKSLTNIGSCPTFEERTAHAETFILDFDDDVYNCDVRIYFIRYIRDEKKYSNANELIMQIKLDKNEALKISGELKWQELGLN